MLCFQMRVGTLAADAIASYNGTVYEVGASADILCKFEILCVLNEYKIALCPNIPAINS
jgi:hypothetical protein